MIHLLQLMNLCWQVITTQSPPCTLPSFLACIFHGLNKCLITCVHHCGIPQKSFTALNIPVMCLFILSPPTPGNHWSFDYVHSHVLSHFSHILLFATPWTAAHQAPLSMGFSRQEYWSGLPFPSLGDLPDPGVEPGSPILQADSLLSEPPEIVLPFPECHRVEITWYTAFSDWFLSLGHMYSQFLHVLSWLIAQCF